MNPAHLDLCASDEWAQAVRQEIVPWVLDGIQLGDRVLEIGPGPGCTTDVLQPLIADLTVVELDQALADALTARFDGTNVTVVNGDATALPFDDGDFSSALTFNMLHHVPTPELQDQVLAELARVTQPGGWVAGVDSLASDGLRDFHEGDTYVPLDPELLPARLTAAGWLDVQVITNEWATRFRGLAPA